MEDFYNQPIILDNGSGTIRCGFSGDESPRICYSNIIGRPKYNKIEYLPSDINVDDTFVGNQAQLRRGLLKLVYPIEHGIIHDWNSMELIWQQILLHDLVSNNHNNNAAKLENQESIDFSLKEHSMLITEHPFVTRRQREKMCEILFETFGISAINIGMPAVLSLYSSGRTTGLSLDIGDGVSCIAPVFDGFALPGSVKKINLGGRDITKLLQLEIMKSGYTMNSSSEFEIVRNMKERLGYVNMDCVTVATLNNNNNKNYFFDKSIESFQLPDGKYLKISKSSLSNPCEVLFQPEIFGFEESNLHESLYNSVLRTDLDLRGKLFETIVLSGGSTLFKNFGSRLIQELRNLDSEVKLKMFASPERRNNCFIGASILATLSTFNKIVVTKKQFIEDSNCVHDKYF